MKLTQIVSSCALVAGLMVFASNKAQSGVVIDNTLYSPLTIKVTFSYVDNNKIKKATETSKQVLADVGFNTGKVKLAIGPGTSERQFDIYVINQDTVLADLSNGSTSNSIVAEINELISTQTTQSNGASKEASQGILRIVCSGVSSSFDMSGQYSENGSNSKINNNGQYEKKEQAKANNLAGQGSSIDLGDSLPVSGNVSISGSGKLVD